VRPAHGRTKTAIASSILCSTMLAATPAILASKSGISSERSTPSTRSSAETPTSSARASVAARPRPWNCVERREVVGIERIGRAPGLAQGAEDDRGEVVGTGGVIGLGVDIAHAL